MSNEFEYRKEVEKFLNNVFGYAGRRNEKVD